MEENKKQSLFMKYVIACIPVSIMIGAMLIKKEIGKPRLKFQDWRSDMTINIPFK